MVIVSLIRVSAGEMTCAQFRGSNDIGLLLSGSSPSGNLVEIIELEDHPWFLAGQFHPEFKSSPMASHALFRDFIAAAIQYKTQSSS